jgi:hypothetical protein
VDKEATEADGRLRPRQQKSGHPASRRLTNEWVGEHQILARRFFKEETVLPLKPGK